MGLPWRHPLSSRIFMDRDPLTRVMEEKSSKRVLIQAMYSSGKLNTLRADRIIFKLMESKHQEALLAVDISMMKDIIAGSGDLSYILSLDVCLLPGFDDSVKDRLHSGSDASRHNRVQGVQEGDGAQVGDNSLILAVFGDEYYGTLPLSQRDGSGVQDVVDRISNNNGNDIEKYW